MGERVADSKPAKSDKGDDAADGLKLRIPVEIVDWTNGHACNHRGNIVHCITSRTAPQTVNS